MLQSLSSSSSSLSSSSLLLLLLSHYCILLCHNDCLFCGNFECTRNDMKQNRFIIIGKCGIAKCGPAKIKSHYGAIMKLRNANLKFNDTNKRSQSRTFILKFHSYVSCNKALFRLLILIVGFTCLPTIHVKFITKCDSLFYYKVRQLFYYKVRQLLLQSAIGITKCDRTPSCLR